MFTWAGAAAALVTAYNKTVDFLLGRQSAAKEDRLVEAGATAQKNVDLEKAVAVKDEQLEIVSKPDETREELLAKAKKRRRPSGG
jgi:hypothetical protein